MTPREKVTDPSQIPSDMTEEQARNFWDDHEVTDLYLRKAGPVSRHLLPMVPNRVEPISASSDEETFEGLKKLVSMGQQNTFGLPWMSEDLVKREINDPKDKMVRTLLLFDAQPGSGEVTGRRRPPSTTIGLLASLQKAIGSR